MNVFDKLIESALTESVAAFARDDLDPTIFQFREDGLPMLRDSIRVQILNDIDEIRAVLPVASFYLIGDILTKNHERSTNIDVSVEVDAELVDNISTAEILHLLKIINGRLAADTMHPLMYYISTTELDDTKIEAVYDIVNDIWIKTPQVFEMDVEKLYSDFYETLTHIDISTGTLKRDIVDVEELERLQPKDLKRLRHLLKSKLAQVKEMLRHITASKEEVRVLDDINMELFTGPEEVQLMGASNMLPEVVIGKLLERYYIQKFISKIEELLDSGGHLELSDNPGVRKMMSGIWKV